MGVCGTDFVIVDYLDHVGQLLHAHPDAVQALRACEHDEAVMLRSPWGLLVIGLRPCENPADLEAWIWAAVAERFGAFEAAEPAALAIARDLGATRVAFRSVRRGWARKLGPAWNPRGRSEFWRPV